MMLKLAAMMQVDDYDEEDEEAESDQAPTMTKFESEQRPAK
jgi:hypothetical protein